eukprot:4385926-Amphidinium_carterae.1
MDADGNVVDGGTSTAKCTDSSNTFFGKLLVVRQRTKTPSADIIHTEFRLDPTPHPERVAAHPQQRYSKCRKSE